MAGAAWRGLLLLLLLASALAAQQRSETLGAHTYQWPPNGTVSIPVYMSSLFSARTQLAYPYYSMKFFCEPKQGDTPKANLGDALLGTTFASSDYTVNVIDDLSAASTGCMVLCRLDPTPEAMATLRSYVESGYTVHWYLNTLPAVVRLQVQDSKEFFYYEGFPLGFVEDSLAYLNNHVDITIRYIYDKDTIKVVAFEVRPDSVSYDKVSPPYTCSSSSSNSRMLIDPKTSPVVLITYSVTWENATVSWDDRWEAYSRASTEASINWFSLFNSLLIVVFLSGMIALIMTRILQTECCKSISMPFDRADTEEVTWKLLAGDVFRAPIRPMLLAALVGNGIQVNIAIAVLMLFGLFGYFTPDQHGSFLTALPVVFAFGGLFAGHLATRAFQHMGDVTIWRNTALITALMLPGGVMLLLLVLNMFLGGEGASNTIGAGSYFALVGIWVLLDVPFVFFGSYLASRNTPPEFPCRTNPIPRMIPAQPWYLRSWFGTLVTGVLPFGVIFVQLFFIYTIIWQKQYYQIWGFGVIALCFMLTCAAEAAVIMCFFHLCNEDYHWWWRSFIATGSSGLYAFLYSIFFYYFRTSIAGFVPTLLYFTYSGLICLAITIMCGSVGYYASLVFVMKIYHGQE